MNTQNEMMTRAAELLNNTDGDGFDELLALNENWLQDTESRDAMSATLNAMQEAAFLLNGE